MHALLACPQGGLAAGPLLMYMEVAGRLAGKALGTLARLCQQAPLLRQAFMEDAW